MCVEMHSTIEIQTTVIIVVYIGRYSGQQTPSDFNQARRSGG